MCRDFFFVRFHLPAFHFNEFRTCQTQPRSTSRQTQPRSTSRQTVDGSPGFAQTIKTSKIDRWFGLIGNQDCNRTKGTSFIAMEPHIGCNPDRFGYERNAMLKWPLFKFLFENEVCGVKQQKCKKLCRYTSDDLDF